MKMTSLLIIGAMTVANGNLWASTGQQDSIERLQMSSDVLHSLMTAPDKGIPEEVMSSAKCIIVVPNLVKGGLIVGGEHGRGIALCRTDTGWSAPAFISLEEVAWG
jgi:SH3 domain-containing YSC84-like protein 1